MPSHRQSRRGDERIGDIRLGQEHSGGERPAGTETIGEAAGQSWNVSSGKSDDRQRGNWRGASQQLCKAQVKKPIEVTSCDIGKQNEFGALQPLMQSREGFD